MLLSAIGVAIGALGAGLLSKAIAGMLVGVLADRSGDAPALAAAFLLVAVIACAVPVFRASRLDPLTALSRTDSLSEAGPFLGPADSGLTSLRQGYGGPPKLQRRRKTGLHSDRHVRISAIC